MPDSPKAVWSIPYVSVAFFPSLKHNFIAYRSSKVYHISVVFTVILLVLYATSSKIKILFTNIRRKEQNILGQSRQRIFRNSFKNKKNATLSARRVVISKVTSTVFRLFSKPVNSLRTDLNNVKKCILGILGRW